MAELEELKKKQNAESEPQETEKNEEEKAD